MKPVTNNLLSRRLALLGSLGMIGYTRIAGASRVAVGSSLLTKGGPLLVNLLRSLDNPYYARWREGGEAFARFQGLKYEVCETQGELKESLPKLSSIIRSTKGNLIVNIVGIPPQRIIINLCYQNRVFFVTHWYCGSDVHPWSRNPYYVCHIGSDHTLAGFKTASTLVQSIGGKGMIVGLGGPDGDPTARRRRAGLEQVLREHPGCSLLGFLSGEWEASTAFEITRAWLAKHGSKINGIWAANDRMAIGALEALRVYRAVGKVPVTAIGIDIAPEDVLGPIRSGEILATVEWDAYYDGGMGLALAYLASTGFIDPGAEPDRHREFYETIQLVTRENVDSWDAYLHTRNPQVQWKDLWVRNNGQIF